DTSNVAIISISDTCINTVNDTNFITVTDTLLINALITSVTPSINNLIKVYPNPAISHLYIDNGNYQAMSGYSIRIDNSLGQQVFQSAINQQQFYVDLSTWSGNGLYFMHLINPQGQSIDIRKIVLQ
ncbi:MAG: T9SS type A sorting domain-containing protein, partial [Bacteroidota bacterium]